MNKTHIDSKRKNHSPFARFAVAALLAFALVRLVSCSGSGSGHSTHASKAGDKPGANWPAYSSELAGEDEVRVKNPNDFQVRVGLRTEGTGKDFIVAAKGTESVNVPNGHYDIYFAYSSDPGGLYQGDSFALQDNGVEIAITKVENGNYGIRKVK